MSVSKTVLCTGANQGLGYHIVEQSALRQPSSTYLLGCRDVSKGHSAIQKLKEAGVKSRLEVLELDVENDQQIASAAEYVKNNFGKLDGQYACQMAPSSFPSTVGLYKRSKQLIIH